MDKARMVSRWTVAACICVVLVFLCMMVLVGCGGSGSAEDVAVKCVKAMIEDDDSSYMDCMAPAYVEYAEGLGDSKEELQSEFKETNLENYRNEWVSACGDDFSANYNALSPSVLEGDELQNTIDELVSDYGYDESSVESAAQVSVTVTASGSSGSNRASYTVPCVKVNGVWYVHRPGF